MNTIKRSPYQSLGNPELATTQKENQPQGSQPEPRVADIRILEVWKRNRSAWIRPILRLP